jgi:tetratricopeptide (TPR) repeat protein
VQQFRNDRDAALASYEEALRLFRAVGDKLGEANVYMARGDLLISEQAWEGAIQAYEQALPIYRAIENKLGQANTLIDLGKAYFEAGRKTQGIACVREAQKIYTAIGVSYWAERAKNRLLEMESPV